ncbi:MAG: YidC/Oxa1 family membrane protein insertase [Actinomycetota bacterium]|nr:YidC/Oxa1 family membrane protein insertase [Actinomycetota bacterium]
MNPWNLLLDLLGGVLNFFYQIIPNLGVAIILLTLAISLVLFPLTLKQTRSMKAMQEIQPEVKRLQKELKGDKEELNKELMALYQERGVNPAAGCLPMIVQMPLWFGLFSVLRSIQRPDGGGEATSKYIGDGVEAINTTFLGMDLTASPSSVVPDLIKGGDILGALPYILLIIFIVAAGFYQQLQTTRTKKDDKDKEQSQTAQSMQTAMKIMPIFFGFISWTLTAGLGIYFATSNLFRVGQQALILRLDERGDDDDKKKPALPADTPPENGTPEKTGPSENASKKKNRRRRK